MNRAFDLPQDIQDKILEHCKELQDSAHRWPCQQNYTKLHGFTNGLDAIGIEVAYDWPTHRREWFFPTEEDKELYDDWVFQCMD